MKRKLLIVFTFIFLMAGISIYADTAQSDYFVTTFFVVRVFNNDLGFRVDYQTSDMKMHSIYMPVKWFGKAAGYGEVIYEKSPAAPYMSVWYKDGKVDHFRLYVKASFSDPSWGVLSKDQVNPDLYNVDTLTIVY